MNWMPLFVGVILGALSASASGNITILYGVSIVGALVTIINFLADILEELKRANKSR